MLVPASDGCQPGLRMQRFCNSCCWKSWRGINDVTVVHGILLQWWGAHGRHRGDACAVLIIQLLIVCQIWAHQGRCIHISLCLDHIPCNSLLDR
jgi:hypothetical protein